MIFVILASMVMFVIWLRLFTLLIIQPSSFLLVLLLLFPFLGAPRDPGYVLLIKEVFASKYCVRASFSL
jgi:hypothetical protein